jgi:hypothetical protein
VQREEVDGFQELAVIVPGFAAPGLHRIKYCKREVPIRLGHLRQHHRLPLPVVQ